MYDNNIRKSTTFETLAFNPAASLTTVFIIRAYPLIKRIISVTNNFVESYDISDGSCYLRMLPKMIAKEAAESQEEQINISSYS